MNKTERSASNWLAHSKIATEYLERIWDDTNSNAAYADAKAVLREAFLAGYAVAERKMVESLRKANGNNT